MGKKEAVWKLNLALLLSVLMLALANGSCSVWSEKDSVFLCSGDRACKSANQIILALSGSAPLTMSTGSESGSDSQANASTESESGSDSQANASTGSESGSDSQANASTESTVRSNSSESASSDSDLATPPTRAPTRAPLDSGNSSSPPADFPSRLPSQWEKVLEQVETLISGRLEILETLSARLMSKLQDQETLSEKLMSKLQDQETLSDKLMSKLQDQETLLDKLMSKLQDQETLSNKLMSKLQDQETLSEHRHVIALQRDTQLDKMAEERQTQLRNDVLVNNMSLKEIQLLVTNLTAMASSLPKKSWTIADYFLAGSAIVSIGLFMWNKVRGIPAAPETTLAMSELQQTVGKMFQQQQQMMIPPLPPPTYPPNYPPAENAQAISELHKMVAQMLQQMNSTPQPSTLT